MATRVVAQPRGHVRGKSKSAARQGDADGQGEQASLAGEIVPARASRLEWAFYASFTLVGLVMRLWDVGSRVLHHDESLHTTYSWYLWERLLNIGGSPEYHYDPMMHGPYQFHLNALMYFLFGGPSTTTARLDAVFCGTALIFLPFFLRRQIGRVSALILSGLFCFSPAYLYYSRFTREDIYFALWTCLFFVSFIRWLDARDVKERTRWLLVGAAAFSLSWATKESTFFITLPILLGFIAGIFIVAYAFQTLAPRQKRAKGQTSYSNSFVEALSLFSRENLRPLLTAFQETPGRAWALAAGLIIVIFVVFYWAIGDPWQWGLLPFAHTQPTTDINNHTINYSTDGVVGAIQYWVLQQTVARGSQPWYYYFLVIPLYEQVAVIFGSAGLVYYLLHPRTRFAIISGLLFFFFSILMLLFGTAGLKGLSIILLIPLVISGVLTLIARPRSLIMNFVLWWTLVTWGLYTYAGEKMPWLTLHLLLPTFFLAAVYLGHLFQSPRWSRKWVATAVLLALASLVSFRSAVALAYADGANPTEMLVYTQTAPDVLDVSNVIHKITAHQTPSVQHVWLDVANTWPYAWYLHDVPYAQGGTDTAAQAQASSSAVLAAPQQAYSVITVGSEDWRYAHQSTQNAAQFNRAYAGYTGYEFKFRWWFPEEDYKAWETQGIGGFLGQAAQPSSWGHLVNWWATRTPFNQADFTNWANVYPFYVYIRNTYKGSVPLSWSSAHAHLLRSAVSVLSGAPAASTAPLTSDVPAGLQRGVRSAVQLTGAPQPFTKLGDVAIGSDRSILVSDPMAQRILAFDRSGRYITSWGSVGRGPGQFGGQFNGGPLGLAVGHDGNVYATDTWNHRIEVFTSSGALVRTFGGPDPNNVPTSSSFYGPRQIAVAPNGNLYIADTGNKRIQVWTPRGRHLFNITEYGGRGFNEPSGVAVDGHGTVYIADYWNRRIARFSPNGSPQGAFSVSGWPGPGDYAEPYLAVDTTGHLFATDAPTLNPHINHVLEFNAMSGRVVAAYGDSGSSTMLSGPSGVATGPDGSLYIVDGATNRLIRVQR